MRRRPLTLLVALSLAGCAAKAPPPSVGLTHRPSPTPSASASAAPLAPSGMPALALGRLDSGAHSPYLASHDDHALALLVTPGAGGALSWSTRALDARGQAAGAARDLGPAPAGLTLLSLRPGLAGGFSLLVARKVEGGHLVELRQLDASGALSGSPLTVYQGAEPPAWIDAVAAPGFVHVYFTTMTAAGGRVHVQEVSSAGELRGTTGVVLDGASSWQAVGTPRGSLLVAVRGAEATTLSGASGQGGGQALAVPVSEGGRVGAREPLQKEPVVGAEIEAVAVGDRVYVGWDDRGPLDLRVKLAALGPDGKALAGPKSVLRSAGDQGLVGLSAGRDGGLLVTWDDLALGREGGRWLRLSALPPDLGVSVAEGMLRHGLSDGSAPAVQVAPWGYAALTVARACRATGEGCAQGPTVPFLVRMDASLTPLGQAPVRLPSGEAPETAWSLACEREGCVALALDGAATPAALAVRLEGGDSGPWAPIARKLTGDGPRVSDLGAVWAGPRLADVATAPVGEGWLAVSVTDHAEGAPPPPLPADADQRAEADKDRAHRRSPRSIAARSAIVTVHPVGPRGVGAPRTLSVRAMSSPGVAIASHPTTREACVAWVARDSGDPEVFLTRVDAEGKRLGQQMLTHARGDILDVALTPVDDGWLVVWVDTRDGNGEVYAARVDAALRRKGPEQRITTAPGDASELALLSLGKTALLAFSDSRGSPADGMGDVYVARLRTEDGARQGEEVRVASTPEHGRALQLQPLADGAVLAWLEQPPPAELQGKAAHVHVAQLDAAGALRSLPLSVVLGKPGPLSSLGAQCQADRCRFIVGRPDGQQLWLAGTVWQSGQREATLSDLAPLFAVAGADVTPALGAGWVLVGDDAMGGNEGRLRRLDLAWPR